MKSRLLLIDSDDPINSLAYSIKNDSEISGTLTFHKSGINASMRIMHYIREDPKPALTPELTLYFYIGE